MAGKRRRAALAYPEFLESIGHYQAGKPASYARVLAAPTGDAVGYWFSFCDHGTDVPGQDDLEYRWVGEISLPAERVTITADSDVLQDPSIEPTHFYPRQVVWMLGKRLVVSPAMWGADRSLHWRVYKAQRVEAAIAAGVKYRPWLKLVVDGTRQVTLAVDEESLTGYLARAAQEASQASARRKLARKLIRFLHTCDPDGFEEPVKAVAAVFPERISSLMGLLPRAFEQAPFRRFAAAKTVRDLALELGCSESTVRRAILRSGCQPIWRRKPFAYNERDGALIRGVIETWRP